MRIADILSATGTGCFVWDNGTGMSTLDATAARLFGLPPEQTTLPLEALRPRIHSFDYTELYNIAALAVTEGTVAEALLRIVAEDGAVVRTLRLRAALADQALEQQDTSDLVLYGLMAETSLATPPGTEEDHPAGLRVELGGPVDASAGQAPAAGDRRRSREEFLMGAGQVLAEAETTADVMRTAAELMAGLPAADFVLFGVRGDRLVPLGYYGMPSSAHRFFQDVPLDSDYPGAVVARTGRALYIGSPDEYRRRFPAAWPAVQPYGRRSWAYLPLAVGGRTIGSWMITYREPAPFAPDERYVLTTVARLLAQALSRVHIQESRRELADSLRRTMRPARATDVPGMSLASRYLPTGSGLQVGGDWYDVIPLPSGRTALVIGDVQGHDVRAAGIMTQLRIALRAYALEGHRPDAVLSRACRFLAELEAEDLLSSTAREEVDNLDDHRFATCLYVETDPATGILDLARAGHPDPLVRMADGTVLSPVVPAGPPLGVDPAADYPTTRLVLGRGDTLLLFTDGLVETGGHDYESGWERLRKALGGLRPDSMEKLADELIHTMHGSPPRHMTGTGLGAWRGGGREDDIALLLLCRGEGARPRRGTVRRNVLTVAQSEPVRVADARHQLRELLYDWADGEQAEGAVLLLSELLANALLHTEGDAVVTVEVAGPPGSRVLRVEVTDSSEELPHRRDPGELAARGRGLLLLEMLADSWGVVPVGRGKTIWFELREDARSPAEPVGASGR
ncbi:SpoIIE family protein phosphatase [Streptomyces sp. TRM 70361]|uniref:SpoIIE family protein phosphatase n=1 Tax=Streptomyces sp. TRM 70361 TaxID=3116553 RepID=UPI002E7C345C|nr:SpoIIE family protein phosphatase [Streptomyces sp. TRM 70361]MEE1942446.1 SpoIIE family protein phosphatase [Streptomyces sp. TRM 70361]